MKSSCSWQPRTSCKRNRNGTALLTVLFLVVLLGAVTMAASGASRSSGELVTSRRAHATARAMAESGINAMVAMIDDSLRALNADSVARNAFLNSLDAGTNSGRSALRDAATDSIGDGAFAIAVVDVSARLDINNTSEAGLGKFFGAFLSASSAQQLARDVAARVRGEGVAPDTSRLAQLERDSLVRSLLGQQNTPSIRNPFESLDELSTFPAVDANLLAKMAPFLTVDGLASINRRSAPQEVITAAGGTLIDAPERLLIVSRGWQHGHPLSHEIQAVYDVSPTGLRLVRWRECTL